MTDKRRNIKRNNIIQLVLGIVIIILLNIISNFVFTRFDLTSEKRYSLSPATKKLIKNLDDIVYFKVYLKGNFPAGFKRLSKETQEMLDEFRAYSDNIQYEFINPSESSNEKERNNIYQQLIRKGLNPTELQVSKKEGASQQIIFPGALVTYKSRELPLQLLINQIGVPPETVLNNSIQALEYNISNIIRKLSIESKPGIAFIEGHGELSKIETADISRALSEYYKVKRVKINGKLNSLTKRERDSFDTTKTIVTNKYEAIIIAKPDSAFTEKDKFIIDQFIMRGGKVLWLIDPVLASMDSLQKNKVTFGIINNLNLDDQLFKYGIRLNTNLIMDLNALSIPLVTGKIGNQPQFSFLPWYFFPIIIPTSKNPIVNNLNLIKTEFVSSIDTIKIKGIKKTILLKTSSMSRTVNTPAMISLDILQKKPDEKLFNKPPQTIAVLLEGKFTSLFKNRIPPIIAKNKDIAFKDKSVPNKMIVVSDGDIIKNQVQFSNGKYIPLPLGYDKYTRQTFGNKNFILNAMNYLCDNSGLISVRSKKLRLRLLNKTKINENKIFWQLLNVFLPVLLIVAFGIIQSYIRKKKYTKTITN